LILQHGADGTVDHAVCESRSALNKLATSLHSNQPLRFRLTLDHFRRIFNRPLLSRPPLSVDGGHNQKHLSRMLAMGPAR